MNIETRLKLSFYQEIASINESHRIFLVQHRETKKIFVKKILTTYNLSVYQSLMEHPIPGLPHLYLLHEENGELTIIEEYISGDTIEELLTKNGAMQENLVVKYISELCDILTTMHNRKPAIIHRDIKPSNVIIAPNGRVYLLDLNAARENISKDEDTVLLGTKGYAAPEQYGFGSSSIRTDIYALGMLMNTMLWGDFKRDVFPHSNLSSVIHNCIQLNPENRYLMVSQVKDSFHKSQEVPEAPRKAWLRFLPPGFRTNNPSHMLIAAVVYLIIICLCCVLEVEGVHGEALIFERFLCFTMFFSIIACAFNYLNIQRLMPLCSHPKRLVRILGIFLLTICVLTIQLIILYYAETVVFK